MSKRPNEMTSSSSRALRAWYARWKPGGFSSPGSHARRNWSHAPGLRRRAVNITNIGNLLRENGALTMTSPPGRRNPRVDEYIDALPEWQQAVCREVRELVHAADPEVEETIKRRVQPYFVLEGNVCALLATKDHVNVFLYDGAIVPDPEGIITGGHDNQTARTVAVYEGDPINAPALKTMSEQIVANNRADGWRRLKRES